MQTFRLFLFLFLSIFLIILFSSEGHASFCGKKNEIETGLYNKLTQFWGKSTSCFHEKMNPNANGWKVQISSSTVNRILKIIEQHGANGNAEFIARFRQISRLFDQKKPEHIYFFLPHYNLDCFFYLPNGEKHEIADNKENCPVTKGMMASYFFAALDIELDIVTKLKSGTDLGDFDSYNTTNLEYTGRFLSTFLQSTGFKLPMEHQKGLIKAALNPNLKDTGEHLANLTRFGRQIVLAHSFPDIDVVNPSKNISVAGINFDEMRSANFANFVAAQAKIDGLNVSNIMRVGSACPTPLTSENSYKFWAAGNNKLVKCDRKGSKKNNGVANTTLMITSHLETDWGLAAKYIDQDLFGVRWVPGDPLFSEEFVLTQSNARRLILSYKDFVEGPQYSSHWIVGGSKPQISGSQDKKIANKLANKYGIHIKFVEFPTGHEALDALNDGMVDFTLSNPFELHRSIWKEYDPVAVFSKNRSQAFPETPTTLEAGFDDIFYSTTAYYLNSGVSSEQAKAAIAVLNNLSKSHAMKFYTGEKLLLPIDTDYKKQGNRE